MLVQVTKTQSIDLRILSLESLFPHEETIPSLLDSVLKDMKKEKYQRDPIIVDPESGLVLDGMHRLGSLQLLGARYALCACINYLNDQVILQRWLRYFSPPEQLLANDISNLFNLEQAENYKKAMKLVDSSDAPLALLSRSKSFVSKGSYDLREIYRRLSTFDAMAERWRMSVDYRPDSDPVAAMFFSDSEYVFYPIAFSKQDIIRAAEARMLFPYKTTRHIVPLRPLGVNYPLKLLQQDDISACFRELETVVKESRIDLAGSDSIFEGRRYPEQLVVFKKK